jgi:hypothetical protein
MEENRKYFVCHMYLHDQITLLEQNFCPDSNLSVKNV